MDSEEGHKYTPVKDLEAYEKKLKGSNGRVEYAQAVDTLNLAEREIRAKLARGLPKKEAEMQSLMLEAVRQGRLLLDTLWARVQRES